MAKPTLQPMALRTVLPSGSGNKLSASILDAWRKSNGPEAQRNSAMALSGAYKGARTDLAQLSRYMPTAGSANSDTIADLVTLRKRSRDQMRNGPIAVGALNIKVSHEIGTGLSYSPAIDGEFLGLTQEQVQAWGEGTKRRFNAWASSVDCDVSRRLDLYAMQEMVRRSQLESGDVFVVTPRITRNGRKRLALQLIEADRVCNPDRKPNTDRLVEGIEIDPATCEAIACYIAQKHPGDPGSASNKWDRRAFRGATTGRRNVLQIFKPLRPDQVRGVPMIAPIIEPLKQLARWSEAELNAAVVSGLVSTFVKMDPEAFQDIYDEDAQEGYVDNASKWSGELESGKAINLLPGESIESPSPGRPNPAFDPFWQAMVRQIGMALEMPYEVLVMHFQSSYSASRAALLMAWKAFRSGRELIVKNFCQPVFELWLSDEVAEGRISAPGFFADEVVRAAWCAAAWVGDGPGSIDPVKDVTAAKERIALGISTKQDESVAFDGRDWAPKHAQRVRETNAEKDDGIYMVPAGSSLAADPQDAAADQARQEDARRAVQSERESLALQVATLRGQLDAMAAALAAPAQVQAQAAPPVQLKVDVTGAAMHQAMVEAAAPMFAQFESAASAVLEREMQVTINVPQQAAPVIHFAPVNNIEAPQVSFEASIPAPTVVMNGPTSSAQRIERNQEDGEIVQTVTTYSYDKA